MINNPPSPADLVPHPTTNSGNTGRFRLLSIVFGLFLLAMALLAVIVAGGLTLYNSPALIPGVQVLGVSIGGMEYGAAAPAVAAAWNQQTITVNTGAEPVTFLATDLGFTLDEAATLQTAYAVGRRPETMELTVQALTEGVIIRPQWSFDPLVAEERLQALAAQLDTPAGNAGILIENGRAIPVPPTPGRVVDTAATLAQIQAQPAEILAAGRLDLVVRTTQPVIGDTAALAAELNSHLAHSLAINAYDPIGDETFSWSAPPDQWGNWITVAASPAGPATLQWQLDARQARSFVETAAAEIGPARTLDLDLATAALLDSIPAGTYQTEMRIYHQQREHVVQAGETLSSIAFDYGIPYPWIQEANPQLNGTLSAGQQITIPSPDVLLPLPVVPNKRIVVSLSEQQMWVYENGEQVWNWPVSTGISSSPTAPGVFQIQSHEENAYAGNWDLWMPHFMGIYRPVPTIGFMNGFHGFPTRNGSNLLWTGDLGRPVTYGCILLSSENAQTLYEWAEEGVVVEVRS